MDNIFNNLMEQNLLSYDSKSDLILTVTEPKSSSTADSFFDFTLKKRWNNMLEAGDCFRYRLNLKTRRIPGIYGLVAQLNLDRVTARRKPQDLQRVGEPFDPNLFNFNKIKADEIVMKLQSDDNILVANASPIEFGNSLLVHNLSGNIPQMVTIQGLQLLFEAMLLSTDPNLRGVYNGPGAYASVNHQHYHLFYLKERLTIEKLNVEHIYGPCYALKDFPSKGFAFQLGKDTIELARNVCALTSYLRENEIAHNLYVTRGKNFNNNIESNKFADCYDTLRVFVFAQEPAFGVDHRGMVGFVPGALELAGQLYFYESETFEEMTEEVAAKFMREITSSTFQKIVPEIPIIYKEMLI